VAPHVAVHAANLELNYSEYLERADNASLSTDNIGFSLSVWVKLESESVGRQLIYRAITSQ